VIVTSGNRYLPDSFIAIILDMNIAQQLENDRKKLLQLDGHNPLLNYKSYKAKGVETTYPFIDHLLLHILSGKPVEFKESKESNESIANAPKSTIHWRAGNSTVLSGRLAKTAKDAHDFMEEQGINILFLGLGMLDWQEGDPASPPWRSPLVLIPVEIKKLSRFDKEGNPLFQIQYNEEEVEPNYSLYAAMKDRYGISLPEMPDWGDLDTEEVMHAAWTGWMQALEKALKAKHGWQIGKETVVLSFFAFTKYTMYKDLDPQKWRTDDSPEGPELIRKLLGNGFGNEHLRYPEEMNLDDSVSACEPMAVLDMDSSQAKVILEAGTGRSMVVEGPPGTGKSQTIANLLADAVYKGKRVLFVAEKTAALDVVRRRLEEVGLGPACLELHGTKTKKSEFTRELLRTLSQHRQLNPPENFRPDQIDTARAALRNWSTAINAPAGNGYSPLELMGLLTWVQSELDGVPMPGTGSDTNGHYRSFRDYAGTSTKQGIGDAQQAGPETQKVIVLQNLRKEVGKPSLHPFYQCGRTDLLLESRLQELAGQLSALEIALDHLARFFNEITRRLEPGLERTINDAGRLVHFLRLLCENDNGEIAARAHLNWIDASPELSRALRAGKEARALHEELQAIILEPAFTLDLLETRGTLATVKDNLFNRIFDKSFRKARRKVLGVLKDPSGKRDFTLLSITDQIIHYQTLAAELAKNEELMKAFFGSLWKKEGSDFPVLEEGLDWIVRCHTEIQKGNLPASLIHAIQLHLPAALKSEWTTGLASRLENLEKGINTLQEWLKLADSRRAHWNGREFSDLGEEWRYMQERKATANNWIRYHRHCLEMEEVKLGYLVDLCSQWQASGEYLVRYFQCQVWEKLFENALEERPLLRSTNGEQLHQLRKNYTDLDQKLKQFYKSELVARHNQQVDAIGVAGQAGYVRENIQRQRRIPAIRKFLSTAFETIVQAKPIFMMSPLSVASFLEAREGLFDLVVFDEASQVDPVDAYGAIMRGNQLIVVGDTQQMPPTNFFKHIADTDDAEDDTSVSTISSDVESIMGMMNARIARPHFLLWHYRSRHDSLIATSNRNFYEEKLLIFPSPSLPDDLLGLHLQLSNFADSPYEGDGMNPSEARTVAIAVKEFAEKHPDKTLGVVAFNLKQADLIEKEILQLAKENEHLSRFINNTEIREPFFVKNLEKVQGDERDVIFISVGYGRTKDGRLSHNFGPLSREGGHRRLNVLITRARLANYIFSNFTHTEIDEERSNSRGTRAFRDFLQYAQGGQGFRDGDNGRIPSSMLEADIAKALRQLGYSVAHQIGSKSYRIDLTVRHAQKKGAFILGIECDGAGYHAAQSVRDRDRLRQSVLENLGWKIYRIWSTDWFYHREQEIAKLKTALEAAMALYDARLEKALELTVGPPPASASMLAAGSAQPDIQIAQRPARKEMPFRPYQAVDTSGWKKLPDIFDLKGPLLERYLLSIIETEAPILREQVLKRITEFHGTILGSRIRSHLENHLRILLEDGRIGKEEDVLIWNPVPFTVPRDYSYHPKKDIEMIPDMEIEMALRIVARDSFSIQVDHLIEEASKRLGFFRMTEGIYNHLKVRLDAMIARGALQEEDNIVRVSP